MLHEGDARGAQTLLFDILRSTRLDSRADDATYTVLGLASCATALGTTQHAATLHGGTDALLAISADDWEIFESRIRERDLETLREETTSSRYMPKGPRCPTTRSSSLHFHRWIEMEGLRPRSTRTRHSPSL
jgi:hypothetical protein